MLVRIRSSIRASGMAALMFLAACEATVPVKQITDDKIGYMTSTFPVSSLSPKIAEQISKAPEPSLNFHKIVIRFDETYDDSGGANPKKRVATHTLVNAGSPYVQEMLEFSNNGIPYSLYYRLSYVGLLVLRSQSVSLEYSRALPLTEVKELKRFSPDVANARANADYTFEFTTGHVTQIAGYYSSLVECHAGAAYAAATLHPKLAGSAVDISCERKTDGVLAWKGKYAFLQQYHVGFLIEAATTAAKVTSKIADIHID